MIVFRNKGIIDPKSITTFGVSSKENPGAIGFFGTGLKYAIAILLREGCAVTIRAGTKQEWTFSTRRDKIRVGEFDVVTMNGRRLGFTTEVGKTWGMWQAFRELYCNCKDESGDVFETDTLPDPGADLTLVIVSGERFREVWENRGEIILPTPPLDRQDGLSIHPGPSKYVFYRGVRAYELNHPSLFTYNILSRVDLTEDRTIKYAWDISVAIRWGICGSQNKDVIQRAVTAVRGDYEASIDFEGVKPSEEFLSVVCDLARKFDSRLSPSALSAARVWIMDELHETAAPMVLGPLEKARVEKACGFCESIGYAVRDYPIVVSEFLGAEVLGRAHDDKIYISKRALMMGTKMLVGTLIEEYIHLRHQLVDESRTMQNFLIDALVSMGEQITGEPL